VSDGLLVRPSRDADIAAIAAIYGHHVLHGVASFEEVPPTVEEMARRRGDILARGFPYLVAERPGGPPNGPDGGGKVVGYCYAGPYRARVIDDVTRQGYRQMIAVIGGSETLPSIRLHAALGFTQIGVFPAIGFKFGRWIDSVYMQRALGPGSANLPQEITHG
jgi:L-amino acid N-acyltransferase YncA